MRGHGYIKAFLRAVGPVQLPVLLGLAIGAVALLVMSDRPAARPPDAPPAVAAVPVAPVVPRIVVPAAEDHARPAGDLFDIRPAPRREALDLTRRLQNGLPPVDPDAKPTPEPARQIEIVRTPEPEAPAIPMIAVVIDDMGYDAANSARAVALPSAVTLSYLPFAPSVSAQVREARRRGHEIMLHLPMEADEHRGKPADRVLSVRAEMPTLRHQLVEMLRSVPAYVGVNNHQGSRFTRDPERMRLVLGELKRRGLFFLDSRTSGGSVGAEVARELGISYAVRDVFLDHDPAPADIRARLADVERIAWQTGGAVAIGHPRTGTLDLLTPWLAGIEARGFRLVPVTDLLVRPAGRPDVKLLAQTRIDE